MALFVKCLCQINLKDRVRCLARSSMNHQSKVKPTRQSTVGHLSTDCQLTHQWDRILNLSRLQKFHFQKCRSSTGKRKAKVFKFLRSEDRFRDGLVWTVDPDVETKLHFQISSAWCGLALSSLVPLHAYPANF